ncbi:ATP/GTP-binding protein [Actinomadura syzygii]|uniref:ATP-binding protein n=1 Tax=Actinomadura syzygii TaxID=1427538 RepID=A0A5D0TTK7_9ACTN|nr:ATP/GTP-binding protein [Actinomadura syzygii]TYC08652.1 ATP-binding protein [Actinomadura syzygii]
MSAPPGASPRELSPLPRSAVEIPAPDVQFKIVIGGGFGAGKTTLVRCLSEIAPLSTEEILTAEGEQIDSLDGIDRKTTTTVAMDFGIRTLTVPVRSALHLFGLPGQDRFRLLWDDLALGAVGAVVLTDTRRLPDCFPCIDYFEDRGTPFVVAVNQFDGAHRHSVQAVRQALELPTRVPVQTCDARDFRSALGVLRALVLHALQELTTPLPAGRSAAGPDQPTGMLP